MTPAGASIAAGIDTLRVLWRRGDWPLDRLRTGGGGLVGLDGWRVQELGDVLALEGHPAGPGELCPPERIPGVVGELRERAAAAGSPTSSFLGVGRMDTTATVAVDARRGEAAMRAFGRIRVPGCKPAVYGDPPETVYLLDHASRGAKLARIYDKGLELARRGVAAPWRPFESIRFEDQRRFKSRQRFDVDDAPAQARALFERRFSPLLAAGGEVLLAGSDDRIAQLVQWMSAGVITTRLASSLVGHVAMQAAGVDPTIPERTRRYRERRLAELGLARSEFTEPVRVDVGGLVEQALAAVAA